MVAISNLLNNGLLLAGQQIYADVATPQQASVEQFNVARYLGAAGPYVQHPGYGISTDIPDQCTLEQVHLFLRHGERYPTKSSGKLWEKIMAKFDNHTETFVGELAFLNDYTFFVQNKNYYEKETSPANSEGTYAGSQTATRLGGSFRAKYKSLFNSTSETLKVFTSNSGRVHVTARNFARGFMGDEYSDKSVNFYVLDEDKTKGANSLTASNGCTAFNNTINEHIYDKYDASYLKVARDRILKGNEGLNLSTSEIQAFFGWCAYELNVRGQSPFCKLFTNEEFIKYSYSVDLEKYYANGPANNMTSVIAAPYLNATLKFLKEENPDYKVLVSFSHDTDIEIIYSGLGLYGNQVDLPVDHIPFPNPYPHNNISPQGGRIVTEKYSCNGQSYVRFILNDAVIPLQKCQSGPGFSCKLSDYEEYIKSRIEGKDYQTQCKTKYPGEVTFLWDYKTANYTANDTDT